MSSFACPDRCPASLLTCALFACKCHALHAVEATTQKIQSFLPAGWFFMGARRHQRRTNAPIAARPTSSSNGARYTHDPVGNMMNSRHCTQIHVLLFLFLFFRIGVLSSSSIGPRCVHPGLGVGGALSCVPILVPWVLHCGTPPAKHPSSSATAHWHELSGRHWPSSAWLGKLVRYGSQQPNPRHPSRCPFSWSTIHVFDDRCKLCWRHWILR